MPQRNGYKSHRGRSAVARRTEFGGASGTNGIMPAVYVMTTTGERVRTSYFGGPKKGGAAPCATGFMTASGARNTIATPAQRPNFLFKFRQSFSRGYPGAGVGALGATGPFVATYPFGPVGTGNDDLGVIDPFGPVGTGNDDLGVIDPNGLNINNPIYITAMTNAQIAAQVNNLNPSGTYAVNAAAFDALNVAFDAGHNAAAIDAAVNAAIDAAVNAAVNAGEVIKPSFINL